MVEFSILQAITIFFLYLTLDILYALYLYYAIDKKPVATATTAAFIYLLSAIGVFAYISNYWYLVPVFLGSFIGTYIVVKAKE